MYVILFNTNFILHRNLHKEMTSWRNVKTKCFLYTGFDKEWRVKEKWDGQRGIWAKYNKRGETYQGLFGSVFSLCPCIFLSPRYGKGTSYLRVLWPASEEGQKILQGQLDNSGFNLSYSGGRDQEDQGSKPAWANSLWDPISKKPITRKGLVA
jgi:hypothetical protein